MREPPLVSVIIPFYNEEICLPRAVQSVLNQSYPNIELILVNDGSTDKSGLIAEKFCEQHSNIQLINTVNGAPGAARNKGKSLANGTYLAFLDADDEFEDQMIEKSVQEAILKKADVVNVGHTLYDENGKVLKIFTNSNFRNVLTGIETIKAVYSNKVFPTSSAKLFRTEVVKPIKFPEKIWFQDNPFFLEILFNSSKIAFLEESLLKVHSRKRSVTRRVISIKRVLDINKAFFIEIDLVNKYVSDFSEKKTVLELIFMTHIGAMLDTFIVWLIDKHKIPIKERQTIRQLYLKFLSEIKKEFKANKLSFTIKKRILFSILYLPKYIGWKIPEILISIIKFKKIKYLKRLKG